MKTWNENRDGVQAAMRHLLRNGFQGAREAIRALGEFPKKLHKLKKRRLSCSQKCYAARNRFIEMNSWYNI